MYITYIHTDRSNRDQTSCRARLGTILLPCGFGMVQLTTDSTITLKQCLSLDLGDMAEEGEIPWDIKVVHVHVQWA